MTRRTLEDHWDRHAPSYDRQTASIERRFFAAHRRWLGERAHGKVLEVAVGTGANLPYYSPEVDVTGIDLSEGMLGRARVRARAEGLNVDLRQGDATRLPFGDNEFDAVVCTFSLCSIPDVPAAVAEMRRVVRPGGDVLVVDHIGSTFWPLRALQHVAEWVTVPLQGEHFTRRPRREVEAMRGLEVVEAERFTLGAIERVHARTH